MTRMTKNKSDPVDSVLQLGCVIDKYFCVVFPTSEFPYLNLCPR